MSRQPDVARLSFADDTNNKLPIYLFNIRKYLQSQVWSNPILQDVIITFSNNSTVITSTNVYTNSQEFYKHHMSYGSLSYEEWQKKLNDKNPGWVDSLTADGQKVTTVTYNSFSSNLSKGRVFISVVYDLNHMVQILSTDSIVQEGSLCLEDTLLGELYTAVPSVPDTLLELEPQQGLSTLHVLGGISQQVIEESMLPQKRILQLYMLLAGLVAILLSVFFTLRQTKPLQRLYETLFTHVPEQGDTFYSGMLQGLDTLLIKHKDIQAEYSSIQSSYGHLLFDMAIHGAEMNDEISEYHHTLPVLSHRYIILVVRSAATENSTFEKRYALELVQTWIAAQIQGTMFHPLTEDLVLVLPLREIEEKERFLEYISLFCNDFLNNGFAIAVGISTVKDSPLAVNRAFSEASAAMFSAVSEDVPYAVYSTPHTSKPLDFDFSELWKILLQQPKNELEEWFSHAEDTLVHSDTIVATMQYYNILSVYQRVKTQLLAEYDIVFEPYRPELSAQKNIERLRSYGYLMKEQIEGQIKEGPRENVSKILEYLNANFKNPEMTLGKVAEAIGFSERYLSSLLAEGVGSSYQEYVTQLRMEEAARLLTTTDLPIKEVSLQSGYDNDSTFYRAFRRWSGMTPTKYRNHKKSEGQAAV